MMWSRRIEGLLLLAACVMLGPMGFTGCGKGRPTTIPVTGTVTLDGKPIAGATVMLQPQGPGKPAVGVTDDQGRFSLYTFEPGDGALPGTYLVTVRKVEVTGFLADDQGLSGPVSPEGIKETWIIPKKYSDAQAFGRQVEVRRGMGPLQLDLTSQ